MHRADIEIVERIEMAYLEHGYTPGTGDYRGAFNPNVRCGMGAIGVSDQTSMSSDEIIVGRSVRWIDSFQIGFDTVGNNVADGPEFIARVRTLYHTSEDASRGFRAGWSCAKRVFSKAPVEVVPVVPLAEPVMA